MYYWLNVIAWASLFVGVGSSLVIVVDLLAGHRHKMAIMNIVWPVTALYLGPLALWGHWESLGMGADDKARKQNAGVGQRPLWQKAVLATTHCGAGCTLGDIIGEWGVFAMGATIAGSMLLTDYLVDFALAYLLGIIFQFLTIVPMKHLPPGKGLWEAIKVDTLSLVAFEIGMFGWMALMHFGFFSTPPKPNQAVYWFMMQLGMIAGFLTSLPANWFLVRTGIKPAM
ncbi:MAG TPA: DUF4396 domain-containing protein [Pirellulales bacterium]|nr:DUF4396 domain-containing protein [Pirellulales bacterium]